MVLGALINHPERLNRDTLYELRSVVARYPYFQTARLLLLNNLYLLHEPDFGAELRRSALYFSDRTALCRLIEGYMDRVEMEDTDTQEAVGIDRTMSLIDAFLGTLPEDQGGLGLQVDAASSDYVSTFLTGDGAHSVEPLQGMELVERFITQDDEAGKQPEALSCEPDAVAVEAPSTHEEGISVEHDDINDLALQKEQESLDESYFTETLAKIYIKQHKYSRALEIIRSLYLKYPEKNIYFADQIRFLEKLIINNNSK